MYAGNSYKGMRFGEMPPEMLMAKFEETNMEEDEYATDEYIRGQITNWGPDTNLFEHELPRGAVNRRSGRLQAQYYGHRGDADDPYRPEYFDGFMAERDPRGSNVDPDFKQLRAQHESRNRFHRFDPDDCEHITSGGRSFGKIMADNQQVFRATRNKLNVFSRQTDGRREGMRREYDHVSKATHQIPVESYGDYIRDDSLNPQRRLKIAPSAMSAKEFRDGTRDTDVEFAKYSQICRRRGGGPALHGASDVDGRFAEGSKSITYHTVGKIMADIVSRKEYVNNDSEFTDVKASMIRGADKLRGDISAVMRNVSDGDFGASTATVAAKNAGRPVDPNNRHQLHNHVTPAHHLLNAELIYKTAGKPVNARELKNHIITDSKAPIIQDTVVRANKLKHKRKTKRLDTQDDTDYADGYKTMSYKKALTPLAERTHMHAQDGRFSAADESHHRRVSRSEPGFSRDSEVVIKGDNQYLERHTGNMGSKFNRHQIDRDGAMPIF